jgi:uncharacterized membrane protein
MENEQPTESFIERVKPTLQQNLRWGGMLVTIGYVLTGIIVLIGLIASITISISSGLFGLMMGGMYLLIAMLYYFPLRRLNGFVGACRDALEMNNDDYLVDGLKDLSAAMRLVVIYTFVLFGFYILMFLLMLVMGISGQSLMGT